MTTPNPLEELQAKYTKLETTHNDILSQLSGVRGELAQKDNQLKDFNDKLKVANELGAKAGSFESLLTQEKKSREMLQEKFQKSLATRLTSLGLTEEHFKGKSIEELEAMQLALSVRAGAGSNPPQLGSGGSNGGVGGSQSGKSALDQDLEYITRAKARKQPA
jgi:hypothetical protein